MVGAKEIVEAHTAAHLPTLQRGGQVDHPHNSVAAFQECFEPAERQENLSLRHRVAVEAEVDCPVIESNLLPVRQRYLAPILVPSSPVPDAGQIDAAETV